MSIFNDTKIIDNLYDIIDGDHNEDLEFKFNLEEFKKIVEKDPHYKNDTDINLGSIYWFMCYFSLYLEQILIYFILKRYIKEIKSFDDKNKTDIVTETINIENIVRVNKLVMKKLNVLISEDFKEKVFRKIEDYIYLLLEVELAKYDIEYCYTVFENIINFFEEDYNFYFMNNADKRRVLSIHNSIFEVWYNDIIYMIDNYHEK